MNVAVITISDKGAAGKRKDESGPVVCDIIKKAGWEVAYYNIVPDEKQEIKEQLLQLSNKVDLILTTGGTGLSPRDVTPEATKEVIEMEIPGIPELMRFSGYNITKQACLSRAVAGAKGQCLIINLPGSPKAAKENLLAVIDVIPHAIEKLKGLESDCAQPL
ncbi:MAG: MogA/MoaB family molybdenum cofactor biosynthesis protein [Candidatus Magnetoovum sp. WYHC-5]|nr:MogA/MoaB family molybdenum cofactor biosynthesis protein [Candidatus Magnetoovum sp. WYHC-5]